MCREDCSKPGCPCKAEGDSADMMNGHAGWDCDESGCPGCGEADEEAWPDCSVACQEHGTGRHLPGCPRKVAQTAAFTNGGGAP